jgi:DNA-binding MarR family transcriptional regulator
MPIYAGYSTSYRLLRAVWREVTARPNASLRELGATLNYGYSTVGAALRALDALGYIEIAPGRTRARRVVVPYVEVRR